LLPNARRWRQARLCGLSCAYSGLCCGHALATELFHQFVEFIPADLSHAAYFAPVYY
jgi:hypothetical protein